MAPQPIWNTMTGTLTALALLSLPAVARPADPDIWAPQMAAAFIAMIGPAAQDSTPAQIEADMVRLVQAFAGNPVLAENAPQAFVQAALLADQGSIPASRAMAYDMARDILTTAASLSDQPQDSFAPLAIWNRTDPFHAELQTGMGLAQSDVEALARLQDLDARAGFGAIPKGGAQDLMMQVWQSNADQPVNQVLPTRLAAWAEGVAAAWPDLTPAEQELGVAALYRSDMPDPQMLEKVIGTGDVIHWLAAVDVPMTKDERAASPELVMFMEHGAFSGPLQKPLQEIAEMKAAQGSAAGMSAAANQLMRLNNWSAMTGEMHSWESYRYMTQGY